MTAHRAWPEYNDIHAYICQPNRSFRHAAHIAFYAEGTIQRLVPRVKFGLEEVTIGEDLPERVPSNLRSDPNLEERHSILSGFLECVYVDIQKSASVVGIKPKPQFMGLFQFMDAKSESAVPVENKSSEPQEDSELDLTGWWRRGRDELHHPVKLEAALRGWQAIPAGSLP